MDKEVGPSGKVAQWLKCLVGQGGCVAGCSVEVKELTRLLREEASSTVLIRHASSKVLIRHAVYHILVSS